MQTREIIKAEILNNTHMSINNKLKSAIDLIAQYLNNDNVFSNLLSLLFSEIRQNFNNSKIIIFGGFLREIIRLSNLDKLDDYLKTDGDIDLYIKVKEEYFPIFTLFINNFVHNYTENNENIQISYKITSKYNLANKCKLYTLTILNLVDNSIYKIDINMSTNSHLFDLHNKFDVSINSLCYDVIRKKIFSKKKELISVEEILKDIENNEFRIIENFQLNEKIDRILKLIYSRKYNPKLSDNYTYYYITWLSLNLIYDFDNIFKNLMISKWKNKASYIKSIMTIDVKSDLLFKSLTFNNIKKCLKCHKLKQNYNNIYCCDCYNIEKRNMQTNKYCYNENISKLFEVAVKEKHIELLNILYNIFDVNKLDSSIANDIIDLYICDPYYQNHFNIIKVHFNYKNAVIDGIIRSDNVKIFKYYCKTYLTSYKKNKINIIKYVFYFDSPNIIKYLAKKIKIDDNIFNQLYLFDDDTFGKICSYNNINVINTYINIFRNQHNSYICNPKTRDEFVKQDNFIENISSKCTFDVIKLLTNKFSLKYNSNCIRKYMDYNNTIDENNEKINNIEFFVRNLRETNISCTIDGNLHYNDIYCTVLRCNPNCYSLLFDNTKGTKKEKYNNMLKIAEKFLYVRPKNICTCDNCTNIKKISYYILAMQFILYIKGCDFNLVNKIAIEYF